MNVKGATTLMVAAMVVAISAGCDRHGPLSTATPMPSSPSPTCPRADVVENLHAAAFFYEHGPAAAGHEHIVRARDLAAHDNLDATARTALESLGRIDGEIATSPAMAKNDVEQLRVAFADWPCLPEDMHQRFHASLPPVR